MSQCAVSCATVLFYCSFVLFSFFFLCELLFLLLLLPLSSFVSPSLSSSPPSTSLGLGALCRLLHLHFLLLLFLAGNDEQQQLIRFPPSFPCCAHSSLPPPPPPPPPLCRSPPTVHSHSRSKGVQAISPQFHLNLFSSTSPFLMPKFPLLRHLDKKARYVFLFAFVPSFAYVPLAFFYTYVYEKPFKCVAVPTQSTSTFARRKCICNGNASKSPCIHSE